MSRLGLDGLGAHLDRFERTLFRLETLPAYAVASDGDDFHRYVRGEPEPDWRRKQPWLDRLAADRVAGKGRSRVRVFSEQLTDYERYACEWGYALNGRAGEDVRVLRRGEHVVPMGLVDLGDFWIADDDQVVVMHYDHGAHFDGAEALSADAHPEYLRLRDEAWDAAETFDRWWARHPELHREASD